MSDMKEVLEEAVLSGLVQLYQIEREFNSNGETELKEKVHKDIEILNKVGELVKQLT